MRQQLADLEVVAQLVVQVLPLFPLCPRADLRRAGIAKPPKQKRALTHEWVQVAPGRHQCAQCMAKAGAQPPLTRCRRSGHPPLREVFTRQGHRLACYACDDGHLLLLCVSYGYYGGAAAKKLAEPCGCCNGNKPMGAGGRRTVSRMLRGWHPTKDVGVRHVGGASPTLPKTQAPRRGRA